MYSEFASSLYYDQSFNFSQALQRSLISGVFAWGASKVVATFVGDTDFDSQYFSRFLKSPFKAFVHGESPYQAWKTVLSRAWRDLPSKWVLGEFLEEVLEGLNPKS